MGGNFVTSVSLPALGFVYSCNRCLGESRWWEAGRKQLWVVSEENPASSRWAWIRVPATEGRAARGPRSKALADPLSTDLTGGSCDSSSVFPQ